MTQDEAAATLRALHHDEIGLIEQRTAKVNQLLAWRRNKYYPAAWEAIDGWTAP